MRRTIGLVRRTTGLHRTQHLVLKHAVFDIRFKHLRPTKPDTSHTNSKLFKSTFQSNNWLLSKINHFQVMGLQNLPKNYFCIFFHKTVKCTKSYFQHSRLKTIVPVSLKHQFTFRKTISS